MSGGSSGACVASRAAEVGFLFAEGFEAGTVAVDAFVAVGRLRGRPSSKAW